jgi:hypothetical protein
MGFLPGEVNRGVPKRGRAFSDLTVRSAAEQRAADHGSPPWGWARGATAQILFHGLLTY